MIRPPPISTPFPSTTLFRSQTPTAATIALALFAAVLTLTGTFRQLVDYVTFGDWLFFASVVATLYVYRARSEEHTSELQSQPNLVCRLLLENKKYRMLHTIR